MEHHSPPRVDADRVARIVTSYVRHHKIAADQLAGIVVEVHRALCRSRACHSGARAPASGGPNPTLGPAGLYGLSRVRVSRAGAPPASAGRARPRIGRLSRPLELADGLSISRAKLPRRDARGWPRRSVSGANQVPSCRAHGPPVAAAGGVPRLRDSHPEGARGQNSISLVTGMKIAVLTRSAGIGLVPAYGATIRDEGTGSTLSGQADRMSRFGRHSSRTGSQRTNGFRPACYPPRGFGSANLPGRVTRSRGNRKIQIRRVLVTGCDRSLVAHRHRLFSCGDIGISPGPWRPIVLARFPGDRRCALIRGDAELKR